MFAASTLTRIDMYLSQPATGGPCTITLNKSGSPWKQNISIPTNSSTFSVTYTPGVETIDLGQYITVDVTAAAGTDLTINILLIAR
jgi:hypothetical protein